MSSDIEISDIEISDGDSELSVMHSDDSLASISESIDSSVEDRTLSPAVRAAAGEHRYLAFLEDDKGVPYGKSVDSDASSII